MWLLDAIDRTPDGFVKILDVFVMILGVFFTMSRWICQDFS